MDDKVDTGIMGKRQTMISQKNCKVWLADDRDGRDWPNWGAITGVRPHTVLLIGKHVKKSRRLQLATAADN